MKQQLRIGSNPIVLQGNAFGRCYLLVQGVASSQIQKDAFSLQYLRTQIEIQQGGIKDSTAFNAVGPVARAISELPHESFPSWNFGGDGQSLGGFYTNVSLTTSTFYVPLLDGGYILKGDDYIRFNIDILPTFMSADVTNGSSVYLVTEEDNGIVQADVNLPVYEPITTDKQSPSFTYDAISECSFLNAIPLSNNFDYQSSPLQAVDFRSKFVTEQFDINTLFAKNIVSMGNPLVNSFPIYYVEPSALWDVQIGLAVNTTNVTIGSQFLYVRKVLTSSSMVSRAIGQEQKITKSSLRHRGVM